jgi:hypothetical protein
MDIKRISHGYVAGYLVDMKYIAWICVDNLTHDRRRRAQGLIHCHSCCCDLNLCQREVQHVIGYPWKSMNIGGYHSCHWISLDISGFV